MVRIEVGVALYALGALLLAMVAADAMLDRQACGRRWSAAAPQTARSP